MSHFHARRARRCSGLKARREPEGTPADQVRSVLSRVGHELRTPMNAIVGFASLLQAERSAPPARQARWLEQIVSAGVHAQQLIVDLEAMSGLNLRAFEVDALVREALNLAYWTAGRHAVTLHAAPAPGLFAVGDALKVRQILVNLLTNAAKYNRAGGRVDVTCSADAASGELRITVRDTGIGMNAEQLAALFQPFNRLGRERSGIEGMGVGLAFSRELAQLMGGRLTASSIEGEGSSFCLSLPRAQL